MKRLLFFLKAFLIIMMAFPVMRSSDIMASNLKKGAIGRESAQEDVATGASFPGGAEGYQKWIHKNARYPKEAKEAGIEETIIIKFTIEPSGKIKYAHVEKGENQYLVDEALRLVDKMPTLIPATYNGEPIESEITWEVEFQQKTSENQNKIILNWEVNTRFL